MKNKDLQNTIATLYTYSVAEFNEKLLQQISIEDLLTIILLSQNQKAEFRAAWALEHIVVSNRDFLAEYKLKIIDIYSKTDNWSALRSLSKIIMELIKNPFRYILHIDDEINELILDKTFKILENNECPIAVRCNAYDILLHIGTNEEWVLSELKTQLSFDLEKSSSPALITRAKQIFKKLERISKS